MKALRFVSVALRLSLALGFVAPAPRPLRHVPAVTRVETLTEWGAGKLPPRGSEPVLLAAVQRAYGLAEAREAAKEELARPPTLAEWADFADVTVEELTKAHKEGLQAREALLLMHMGLVRGEAARLAFAARVELPYEDLLQEGMLGLTRAMEKYELDRAGSIKFSTYATFWIKEALQRATMSQSRIIRVPSYQLRQWRKVQSAQRELESKLGREPRAAEIADALGMEPEAIIKLQEAVTRRVWSLDAAMTAQKGTGGFAESEVDKSEIVSEKLQAGVEEERQPEDAVEHAEFIELVERILPKKERDVVVLKFGASLDEPPRSNPAVAKILGTYPDTVRLRLKRAMARLREEVEKDGVDEDALEEAVKKALVDRLGKAQATRSMRIDKDGKSIVEKRAAE